MTHPWEIPASWEWRKIGEVTTIVGGGTPKTSDPNNFEGGETPWITPADLSGYKEKYISSGARNITEKGLNSSSARLLPANAVLFSSRAPIGYTAIASQPVTTNQGFKSFILPSEIDSSFFYFYLHRAKETIESLGGGTTFKEISGTTAATIPLVVAPLPEQHRIVAEIETQFTRLDASVAALRRAQANLKRYRASVLKDACDGRLVPTEAELARSEGREYEPAGVLLDRILAERRARWESQEKRRGKYKEPVPPDMSGLPELPEGWVWGTVEQLLARSEYGTSVKCSYEATGFPILRIPNIVAAEIDLTDIKYATQPVKIDSETSLAKGDVLMCRTNGSVRLVGKTAVVHSDLEPYHGFASYLLRFRLMETEFIPKWFHIYSTSQLGRAFIEQNAASSAGQNNVSLTLIHTMPIPLPDKGMYFIWDFTQLNVRPHSRVGLLKYKTAPKCSLSGPFRHSGLCRNPGAVGPVRSYNLNFTYPCQHPPPAAGRAASHRGGCRAAAVGRPAGGGHRGGQPGAGGAAAAEHPQAGVLRQARPTGPRRRTGVRAAGAD